MSNFFSSLEPKVLLKLFWLVMGAQGLVIAAFGVFCALQPRSAITLYQHIMARINWRVEPIDLEREVKTTRRFGFWLLALVATLAAIFVLQGGVRC